MLLPEGGERDLSPPSTQGNQVPAPPEEVKITHLPFAGCLKPVPSYSPQPPTLLPVGGHRTPKGMAGTEGVKASGGGERGISPGVPVPWGGRGPWGKLPFGQGCFYTSAKIAAGRGGSRSGRRPPETGPSACCTHGKLRSTAAAGQSQGPGWRGRWGEGGPG